MGERGGRGKKFIIGLIIFFILIFFYYYYLTGLHESNTYFTRKNESNTYSTRKKFLHGILGDVYISQTEHYTETTGLFMNTLP